MKKRKGSDSLVGDKDAQHGEMCAFFVFNGFKECNPDDWENLFLANLRLPAVEDTDTTARWPDWMVEAAVAYLESFKESK